MSSKAEMLCSLYFYYGAGEESVLLTAVISRIRENAGYIVVA